MPMIYVEQLSGTFLDVSTMMTRQKVTWPKADRKSLEISNCEQNFLKTYSKLTFVKRKSLFNNSYFFSQSQPDTGGNEPGKRIHSAGFN